MLQQEVFYYDEKSISTVSATVGYSIKVLSEDLKYKQCVSSQREAYSSTTVTLTWNVPNPSSQCAFVSLPGAGFAIECDKPVSVRNLKCSVYWIVVKFLLESMWSSFFCGVPRGICKMDIILLHELRCYCLHGKW